MSLSDLECKIMSDDMRNELTGMSYYCHVVTTFVHSFRTWTIVCRCLGWRPFQVLWVFVWCFHHVGLTYDYEGNGVSLMFLFQIHTLDKVV